MEDKPTWDYTPTPAPYPNRVMELAGELRRMRDVLAETRRLIGDCDKAIKETEISLIPVTGWPGKNEDERKLSQARVYADYTPLIEYRSYRAGHISIAERLEASIQSARDEMRAWELSIQDNLTMVLGGVSAFVSATQLAGKQAAEDEAAIKEDEFIASQPEPNADWPGSGVPVEDSECLVHDGLAELSDYDSSDPQLAKELTPSEEADYQNFLEAVSGPRDPAPDKDADSNKIPF